MFPRKIILCAVRWYLRYPLSDQNVDVLAERAEHLRQASGDWHVDETYIRVGGKRRYLWHANGQMKVARAFLRKAIIDALFGTAT